MASAIPHHVLLTISLGALLAACGGGSGGGGGQASLTPPAATAPGDADASQGDSPSPDNALPDKSTPPDDGDTAGNGDATTPPPSPIARSATVSWDAPTTKTDGSCLSGLASYRISYGLAPGVYGHEANVDAADLACTSAGTGSACGPVLTCSYMVDSLETASWYFAVQAIDTAGNESGYSNEAIKTIQ